ncbi:MAG TPA: DUF5777 family beta-barrel protein [Vicinamibacterales bacterium]|nr:DUF5777 family beta-barrel protein [Vicinamibacterales bacterium]
MTQVAAIAAVLTLTLTLAGPAPAAAQANTGTAPAAAPQDLDPDLRPVPAEPDFTLGALPTTLRLAARKGVFHMTHRFTRPVNEGSFGDFMSDFFGLDSSSRVGLEVRYGLRPGTQAALHRTNDRTIQFSAQHEFLVQTVERPFTLHGLLTIEGRNNFGLSDEIALPDADVFSSAIGVVLSHRIGTRGAVYLQPIIVINSNVDPAFAAEPGHSALLGLAGRYRLSRAGRAYVFAEFVPRVAGFDQGVHHFSFGIEERIGQHVFQFNVSNSLGTTMAQLARGGPDNNDWFIGFNLTRKFY